MKKLTTKIAKSIALKYFRKDKNKIEKEFALIHAEAVAKISKLLAKRLNANISVVEACAWVHDIGKIIEIKNHAEHSLVLLEKEKVEITHLLRDCILNHGTNGKPLSLEAKILQMADKMSILSIPVLKLILEQEKIPESDVEFVNKLTTGAVNYLKDLV
jgi:putative nucleotidyltransferase with HDIG domain